MKTAICCIVKNEHKFIKEWVDYHLSVGIDHIYIYEDYGSESHAEIFKCYDNVFVTPLRYNNLGVYNHHSSGTQFQLYRHFLNYVKEHKLYDWVLFTDVDEFLMFEDDYNLEKLEEEFKNYAGVWLSWKFYGANGHIKSPEGGVLKNYTTPSVSNGDEPMWSIKSFVNVNVAKEFRTLHAIKDGVHTDYTNNIDGPLTYKKAWLNHYYSKSWEDYVYRMCSRGNMSNNYRSFDQFFILNPDMLYLEKQLIDSIRNKPLASTMWISRKLKLIAGGNIQRLNELKKKFDRYQ